MQHKPVGVGHAPAGFSLTENSIGIGLRRAFVGELQRHLEIHPSAIDFVELAPENWLHVGGSYGAGLAQIAQQVPIFAHGLSLSLGGTDPIDTQHVADIKAFIAKFQISIYSEHLSASASNGHLYDLMPLPFDGESVQHLSRRIRQVQDQLGMRMAVENSSYYCALSNALSEIEFINAVLQEADCDLLLDVNNVYVNARNNGYDARQFIDQIPPERVRYLHVAGHHQESADLIIDTHGADVIAPVWELLRYTQQRIGPRPSLLERDFDFPPLATLLAEAAQMRAMPT
jgi:uncharacterized protein